MPVQRRRVPIMRIRAPIMRIRVPIMWIRVPIMRIRVPIVRIMPGGGQSVAWFVLAHRLQRHVGAPTERLAICAPEPVRRVGNRRPGFAAALPPALAVVDGALHARKRARLVCCELLNELPEGCNSRRDRGSSGRHSARWLPPRARLDPPRQLRGVIALAIALHLVAFLIATSALAHVAELTANLAAVPALRV